MDSYSLEGVLCIFRDSSDSILDGTNKTNETDIENKKYFIISCIHDISEIIVSLFNKSTFTVGYSSLNKMNEFVKVHKDKTVLSTKLYIVPIL